MRRGLMVAAAGVLLGGIAAGVRPHPVADRAATACELAAVGPRSTGYTTSPWGFYTLSQGGTGLPDLVIHAQPTVMHSARRSKVEMSVRYSWADHPGNQEFTYKVGLLGVGAVRAPARRVGGGRTPAQGGYPARLIDEQWPVITFVSDSADPQPAPRGLGAWPASAVGAPFLLGERSAPRPSAFRSIPAGMVGEYRIGPPTQPWLYASPIDRQLHLLGAQAGLFQVNATMRLLERNLGPGPYLNDWRLEVRAGATYRVVARLDALDGRVLLYAGASGLRIALAPFQPAAFTTLPPTTPATWQQFVRRAAAYQAGNNPLHLRSWMPAGTAVLTAARGSLADVVPTASGFQAIVAIGAGGAAARLPGLPHAIAPGRYALRYQAARDVFQMVPLDAGGQSPLHIAAVVGPAYRGQSVAVSLTVANRGAAPWRGAVAVQSGRTRDTWSAAIPVGGVWRAAAALPAGRAARLALKIHAGGAVLRRTEPVAKLTRPPLAALARLSFDGAGPTLGFFGGLAALAGLSAQIWRRHTRGPAPSRRRSRRKLAHAR